MDLIILKILFECLLITILIETSLSIILGLRKKIDIINVVLVQVVTNPIVVSTSLYLSIYHSSIRNIVVLILEVLVVLSEGFMYKKFLSFKKINPFILSIILNLVSFLFGLIIY